MKKFIFIFLLAFLLAPLKSVSALSSEHIISFDTKVHIPKENKASFVETIKYDFGSLERHGIYRDIPIDYVDENGQTYKLAANLLSVTDENGQRITNETSKEAGNFRIKIGDEDKLISGVHTYIINYELWPILTLKNGQSFLNLDLIGTDWNVPINNATAEATFDDGVKLTDEKCYSGLQGSKEQNCEITGNKIVASNLKEGEGLSINGYLPASYTSKYLEPGKMRPFMKDDIIGLILLSLVIIAGLTIAVYFITRYINERRRKAKQTIIPEYEPPKGLTPAQIGHLHDDKTDNKEIASLIINMAVNGYLKVEQVSPKKWYKKAKYALIKQKEPTGLSRAELLLFNRVFNSPTDSRVELSKIDKTKMSETILSVYAQIKRSLVDKGLYGSYDGEGNIIKKIIDAGNITDAGAVTWAKVEGFKLYLSVVEKDRLNFSDAPEKTPELFNKYLPYAIALGVEKKWAKQFDGINLADGTHWYIGGMYSWYAFSDIARDISVSLPSATSSNSSASSFGGFSGGGFGGGGGRSW